MLIDRILFPVTALGPGNRLCIWTVGCYKRCVKCANPELHTFDKTKEVSIEQLKIMLSNIDFKNVDGVTISGGEPFAQSDELMKILNIISSKVEDILIFTGYTYEELISMKESSVQKCFKYIGVLISGEYIDAKNDNTTSLIASTNQEMHFFNESLKGKYQQYMTKGRQIQNVFWKDSLISIGIHNNERSF